MIDLLDTAKRVKRGARLLDRKVPNWRATMRTHAAAFDIQDTDVCILGTLEHYNGRMKVLNARKVAGRTADFYRGAARLGIAGRSDEFGFDAIAKTDPDTLMSENNYKELDVLWRAEFER